MDYNIKNSYKLKPLLAIPNEYKNLKNLCNVSQ